LDPALLRPGRFDRQILVDRPDINGREAILKIHSKQVLLSPEVDLHQIAARTPGFVALTWPTWSTRPRCWRPEKARKKWVRPISMKRSTGSSVGWRKETSDESKGKEIIAFHESGHALVRNRLSMPTLCTKFPSFPGDRGVGVYQQQPTEDAI